EPSTIAYNKAPWSAFAFALMYSPARFPAAASSGSVIPRVCAEICVSCCTMSKNVASFLPASCQQSETVHVKICSVLQLCGAVESAEGVVVTGDFGCCALPTTVDAASIIPRPIPRAICLTKRIVVPLLQCDC